MSERVEIDGGRIVLYRGDALAVLPTLASGSVDAVVTDPPYPCIKRSYGYWTEEEWFALMNPVVAECRRILKSTGSAVFILQPNSERVGRMRTWLWDFLAKWGREWGVVQDAYWWNITALATVHAHRDLGLMRPSVKQMVWLGAPDCWRNQDAVLWEESQESAAKRLADRAGNELRYRASGYSCRDTRQRAAAVERDGVTPFNLLPVSSHADAGSNAARRHGHGASTPLSLLRWWTRYICPPGGVICDPFAGSGTSALAAMREDRSAILIERVPEYCAIIRKRIAEEEAKTPLFAQRALPEVAV